MAGSGGTGGSGGGTVACGQVYDSFFMDAYLYDGSYWGCWEGSGGQLELDGLVMESYPNGLIIDSCPPTMDCAAPMISEFYFDAPGLETWVPVGAFVRVIISVEMPWGCEQRVVVRNQPQWDGVPNPVSMGRELYLAAADGTFATMQGMPFEIGVQGLGCYPGAPGCGGEPTDDYLFEFRSKSDPGADALVLGMGQQAEWKLAGPDGSQYMTVRNLRSYASGMCDDYWNWAYWMTPVPFEAHGP